MNFFDLLFVPMSTKRKAEDEIFEDGVKEVWASLGAAAKTPEETQIFARIINEIDEKYKRQKTESSASSSVSSSSTSASSSSIPVSKDANVEKKQAFACPVCLDLPRKPVITSCSHSFCKECIEKVVAKDDKCPICRTVTTKVFIPNLALSQVLEFIHPESKERIGYASQRPVGFIDRLRHNRESARQVLKTKVRELIEKECEEASKRTSKSIVLNCECFDHLQEEFIVPVCSELSKENPGFKAQFIYKQKGGQDTDKIRQIWFQWD
jgi:hypothetical protein